MKRSNALTSYNMNKYMTKIEVEFVNENDEVTDVLKATIRPFGIQPVTQKRLLALGNVDETSDPELMQSALGAIVSALSELVVAWDLTDDDGNIISPTIKILETFGFDELQMYLDAIQLAVRALPLAKS